VWAVGLGNPVSPKDIIVSEVRTNPVAYRGQSCPWRSLSNQPASPTRKIPVDIYQGDSLLQRVETVLGESGEKTLIPVTVTPEKEGSSTSGSTCPRWRGAIHAE